MGDDADMTAGEQVERQLARIDRLDRSLKSFALVTPELAREAAWAVDRDRPAGPLAGRTLAVKDLFDMRGLPTGAGARSPVTDDAAADATAVARLRAAGMVPLGKAAMVEFAFGTWGINSAAGTPRNPWDPAEVRVPGGSSSGSAVAVAAGLADMALGSDTGGSIRIPCALNGLTGLKPSAGRAGRAGTVPLSPTLDTVGPMAWSVEEAAWMFQRMAGPDPADPTTAAARPFDAASALSGLSLKGCRLAILGDALLAPVETAVGDAYLAAIAALEKAGARLVEARPPIQPAACMEPTGLLIAAEAWRLWHQRVDRLGGEMDPGTRTRLQGGATVGAADLGRLHAARAADQARYHGWAQEFSAMLTPTVPIVAPRQDGADQTTLPFSTYTRMANWLDLPALALPCGHGPAGLPISLQILGLPGGEEAVTGLGHAYQQLTDWHRRRPDMTGFA